MLSYRESKSFLWYTSESDELGRGSFGIVFRGVDKQTGEPCAVKIPHDNVAIPSELEARELDVCKRVDHPNIVKLIGYEQEQSYGRRERPKKVLVMELCDGGSLYKILEHPKNHFGLEENEFLTVLRDLTAGMEYLRSKEIIHRDLKPANIMRCISDDGSSIYKITDFGAARELEEHQEYSSIFGTEEYLHPDVYEQALLPDSHIPNKKFSPSTDLWSIGATLYHVATGMLPFRPEGGRKNRRIMHLMTTKKESGVISAYQTKGTEKIVFEKQLPKNCLLSSSLKKMVCPLLAGLMEVDPRKKLTFESYFKHVHDILSAKKLDIFYFNKLQVLKLYIHESKVKGYTDLCQVIEKHTGVKPDDQVMIFKHCDLKIVLRDDGWESLPVTSEDNPVILFSRGDSEVVIGHDKVALRRKLFPNTIEYHIDADIATHNCVLGYVIARQVNSVVSRINLTFDSVEVINQVVITQLNEVSKANELVRKSVDSIKNQFSSMVVFHSVVKEFSKIVPEELDKGGFHENVKELDGVYKHVFEEFKVLEGMVAGLEPAVTALLGSRVQDRCLIKEWGEALSNVKGISDFLRLNRVCKTLVSQIDTCYSDFTSTVSPPTRRRAQLMPEEECIHVIERTKMVQTIEKLERLQTECNVNATSLTCVVSEWFKKAGSAYIQPEILLNDITMLNGKISSVEGKLVGAVQEFNKNLSGVCSGLRVIRSKGRNDKARVVRERLHELVLVQNEIQGKFKVNFELCEQLQGLLLRDGEA